MFILGMRYYPRTLSTADPLTQTMTKLRRRGLQFESPRRRCTSVHGTPGWDEAMLRAKAEHWAKALPQSEASLQAAGSRKPTLRWKWKRTAILETLAAIGQAQRDENGYSA